MEQSSKYIKIEKQFKICFETKNEFINYNKIHSFNEFPVNFVPKLNPKNIIFGNEDEIIPFSLYKSPISEKEIEDISSFETYSNFNKKKGIIENIDGTDKNHQTKLNTILGKLQRRKKIYKK